MSLLEPELQLPVRNIVLFKLTAISLSRLACTCHGLRALVRSADDVTLPQWQAQAGQLGSVHPDAHSTSAHAILQALNQQAIAKANLKAGR